MTDFGPPLPKIHYSRWERLHFFLFRVWPERVVERRLVASARYEQDCVNWWMSLS